MDTGADVSLIDEPSWVKLGKLMLRGTTERLRNASGKLMEFKGRDCKAYLSSMAGALICCG